jgi:hypothetical protein
LDDLDLIHTLMGHVAQMINACCALHWRFATLKLLKAAPELVETAPQIGWIVIDTCKYDGPLDADEELVSQVGCGDLLCHKWTKYVH